MEEHNTLAPPEKAFLEPESQPVPHPTGEGQPAPDDNEALAEQNHTLKWKLLNQFK
jgi:hypothetical protein